MCIFHKWTKWETYKKIIGFRFIKEERYDESETWQKEFVLNAILNNISMLVKIIKLE